MTIKNKEEYKEIAVSELGLSKRAFFCLMRGGVSTLYSLIEKRDELADIRNMGAKTIKEIDGVLERVQGGWLPDKYTEQIAETEHSKPKEETNQSLPESILQRPIEDMRLSVRVQNAFLVSGIKTIGQAIELKLEEIIQLRNMGRQSVELWLEQRRLLLDLGESYFSVDEIPGKETEITYDKMELDIDTAKRLIEDYKFKTGLLCDWYGISRQRVYQKLQKRVNKGRWCGKQLSQEERTTITEMVCNKVFEKNKDGAKYYLFNNMRDNCAFLIYSPDEIKCFFLEDLPEALQALIKAENVDRFAENEFVELNSLGKIVNILKQPHFMPNEAARFRNMAAVRNMSNEEYAQFLFGIPYVSSKTVITDERIIEFLKDNTVDGRTFISSSPDNQWIRSYISRSSFSTDEFISFYGFNTDEEIDIEFDAEEDESVERDMQVYPAEGDYLEKIYAESPLLGSRLISAENLEQIKTKSRQCIERALGERREKLSLKAKMMITLAVIDYAKYWDTEDESSFWKYITTQFGYRDESGQLRNLLCGCVKDALVRNHRWFVTGSDSNLYKSSIVAHAFSTKRSWIFFCDFLFDFYKNNLNWDYIEDDPTISRMVSALSNRLQSHDDVTDEDLEISSKVYYFREGIIKLIINRPKYSSVLIGKMLKRINELINHEATPANTYEEYLCDEWMTNKLREISDTKQKSRTGERRAVAVDYKRIRPSYRLYEETEIQIVFPDVRLEENEFTSLQVKVLRAGEIIEQHSLSYYGNELGKTMTGFNIDVEDYLRRSGSDRFDPTIVIECDEKEIYNSGTTLFRSSLGFKGKTETDVGSLARGGQSIFVPASTSIEFSAAEVSTIKETQHVKGYYAELQEGFVVSIDGAAVAFDSELDGELRISVTGIRNMADYLFGGTRYRVISGNETVRIFTSVPDAEKQYQLLINEKPYALSKIPSEQVSEARIYKLELGDLNETEITVAVADLSSGRLLFKQHYKIIPQLRYRFNRPFYFSSEDYHDAKIRIKFQGDDIKEYSLAQGEPRISIPYDKGEMEITIPILRITDNANHTWDGDDVYWMKDIPQERFLYLKAPDGIKVELFLNEQMVGTEGHRTFALGNMIAGYSPENSEAWLYLDMVATSQDEVEQTYRLAKIAACEMFLETPALAVQDAKLTWNQGRTFIGDPTGSFKVRVCEDSDFETTYELSLTDDVIAEDIQLPIGEYGYSIYKESNNLFSAESKLIASGRFFVGDKNEIRFLNHIIQIDAITFEEADKYESIEIRPCYIDHIDYLGIQMVLSEERECPVYKGIMYFVTDEGYRREYSYQDREDKYGNQLYQINPVRIVFINDRTLCITNEDEAGFYYYRYFDKYLLANVYQLTDREPTKQNRGNYSLADLYTYTRKEV